MNAARKSADAASSVPLSLRLLVDAGGCSGFQYKLTIENAAATSNDMCVAEFFLFNLSTHFKLFQILATLVEFFCVYFIVITLPCIAICLVFLLNSDIFIASSLLFSLFHQYL